MNKLNKKNFTVKLFVWQINYQNSPKIVFFLLKLIFFLKDSYYNFFTITKTYYLNSLCNEKARDSYPKTYQSNKCLIDPFSYPILFL